MFKFGSLFTRTFIFICTSLILIMILFSYYTITNKEVALIDTLHSKVKTIAKSIALVSSDAMVTEDYSFIVQHNEKVIEDNINILYLIVTKDNSHTNVINDKNGWSMTKIIPDALMERQRDKENALILSSTFSSDMYCYHFTYPIVFSGIEWGWVSVGFSLQMYYQEMRNQYIESMILLVSTFILSLVFTFALTKWLVGPIILLKDAAKQVALGDLSVNVNIRTKDELGELASSFNEMIETIKISDKKLRNSNYELELRVIQRTLELNDLNIGLDKRVKDEVHKRREQEQILIQQSRFAAMGEMIGNIAHQWRQPLNAIGLLIQNIENAYEMGMLDDAYINRTVEKGNRLTKSMSQTVDDFRNFFKPNKEAIVFSLLSAVESSLDMIRSSFLDNMIDITYEVDKNLCIKGFPSEFSQVLLNVLNNARDALLENKIEEKKIFISSFNMNEEVGIIIKDNAGGIPEKILHNIFDPYFTTKDEGKGTGIGLYMSKTIIENNMNGKLSVENGTDGAIFSIKMKLEVCNEKII